MKVNKITMMVVIAMAGLILHAAETPVLKVTKVQQRYPWNGLVDIDVTVKGLGTPPLYFTAVDNDTGRSLTINDLSLNGYAFSNGGAIVRDGDWRFVWNSVTDVGAEYVATNVTVSVSNRRQAGESALDWMPVWRSRALQSAQEALEFVNEEQKYYEIDLTGGDEAESYPVTSLGHVKFSEITDEYKNSKLLMAQIPKGIYVMQNNRPVTLTQDFYMGVFEVTQKQYELVTGKTPSSYSGDARPVECVSWHDAMNFIAKLNAKVSGVTFALPTEAQWEYACRAGTTSNFNNGTDNIAGLGRYNSNRSDGNGGYSQHTTVGSYAPNAWGLYDMHGNVGEWCADWYGSLGTDAVTDPTGSSSGNYRVVRGGCWNSNVDNCTSSDRDCYTPDYRYNDYGFRLICSQGL